MKEWLSGKNISFRGATVLLVFLCLALALFLRIALPYDQVFKGELIKFTEVDAYSHMRLVDNLLQHFPDRTPFDPYTYFPEGAPVYYPPLFTLLLGGAIWLFSLGAPTAHGINVIGALFPAVLGSLTVIPVFFIGKTLFNKWAGLIGAFLLAILPGEILGRTLLGFTDHHVAEIFFTTMAMMFLVLALKSSGNPGLIAECKPGWKVGKKVILFSLLAGLFLGLYLQVWAGGPLFILILFIYFATQFIINHLRGRPAGHIFVISSLVFITASVITLPFLPKYYSRSLYTISLVVASVTPALLFFVSKIMVGKTKPVNYALTIIGAGIIGIVTFQLAKPELLKSLLSNFGILSPSNLDLTIGEVQPFFFPDGKFTFGLAWSNFTTAFFISVFSLGFLIYQVIKRGEEAKTLLMVWSLFILVMTLGQRRFAYYLAINIALLTAYLSWQLMTYFGLKERLSSLNERTRTARTHVFVTTAGPVKSTLISLAVFIVVFLPNIKPAIDTASQVPFAPEDAWCESLNWLRENSPEPFGNPEYYFSLCQPPSSGPNYDYPDSAYGVMAWWDYGHWISRIAHRLPNHAPGGGRSSFVADCFLAQNETDASKLVSQLDSRYIIADYTTALYKFHGVATFAGDTRENYFEICYQNQNGIIKPVTLFYPEYYRSFLIRLYMFDGKAISPEKCTVVALKENSYNGESYKEIVDAQVFDNYQDAQSYLAKQKSGDYRIVGLSPFVSPVPLEALESYRLIYTSLASTAHPGTKTATPVKIFINMGGTSNGSSNVQEISSGDSGS